MNLDRFERTISNLREKFEEEGFYKNPDKFDIDVFGKFLDYHSQAIIITSRLEEDVTDVKSFQKYMVKNLKKDGKINDTEIQKFSLTFPKLMLDLSDFYIYSRIFLDTLTVCIERSFKSAGKENWKFKRHSINCLLNEDEMQKYKNEIDLDFFEGLEKKLTWIRDFRKSRDGLLHEYFHFVFMTTRQGDLGYDIMDRVKTSWGTDTVKGILKELQNIIDKLTDLIEYLLKNLPSSL
jgi:hypothetical protein